MYHCLPNSSSLIIFSYNFPLHNVSSSFRDEIPNVTDIFAIRVAHGEAIFLLLEYQKLRAAILSFRINDSEMRALNFSVFYSYVLFI